MHPSRRRSVLSKLAAGLDGGGQGSIAQSSNGAPAEAQQGPPQVATAMGQPGMVTSHTTSVKTMPAKVDTKVKSSVGANTTPVVPPNMPKAYATTGTTGAPPSQPIGKSPVKNTALASTGVKPGGANPVRSTTGNA